MTMARRVFLCTRCQAVLAKMGEPNYTLHIEAVSFTYNMKYQSLTVRCHCGQTQSLSLPRKVEVFGADRKAA